MAAKINVDEIVAAMTTEEKVNLVHGVGLFHNGGAERVGIPSLIMSDGPMGVRFDFLDGEWKRINEHIKVNWLISGAALASTWDEEMAYKCGDVLGKEARGRGKDIILAPGINIHRTPLCGRNFEYMGEDPYLTGRLVAKEVQGIQSNDVACCVKHFALNNQETDRMEVDVRVSDKALYDIYLPAFYEAVTAGGAYSVMCSYNRFRGDYVSDSRYLLTEILRDKWNFDGVVISDWSAVHSTKKSFEAGVDIDMGVTYDFDEYHFAAPLLQAVKNGEISEDLLDEKVKRIINLMIKIKKIGEESEKRSCGAYATAESQKTLHEAAKEAVVLLKNEDILPIKPENLKSRPKIAVIGDGATRKLALGGGSSEIDPLFEITPLMGIDMIYGSVADISYAPGYYVDNENHTNGDVNWQADSLDCPQDDSQTDGISSAVRENRKKLLAEAADIAKDADYVFYFGGLNRSHDTEGFDRTSYKLPYGQDEVINCLLEINPDMVIVINSGSAVDMSSFAHKAKAVMWSSMLGMTGGLAISEALAGVYNPSGKTPVSFPEKWEDCPARSLSGRYDEELMVGYRYYTTKGVKPLFCFGHGLSYTTFEYSDLKLDEEKDGLQVSFAVKNTGDMAGRETTQLYIEHVDRESEEPVMDLKGFEGVELSPGETKMIKMKLSEQSFARYDENESDYTAKSGKYVIHIGASSEDIKLSECFALTHF